jgi:hypothetical protein
LIELDHPDTLQSIADLAYIRKWQGRDEHAIDLIKEALMLQAKGELRL